jgi:hypothetical protein
VHVEILGDQNENRNENPVEHPVIAQGGRIRDGMNPWTRVHEVQEEKMVIVDSLQYQLHKLQRENEALKEQMAKNMREGGQGAGGSDN